MQLHSHTAAFAHNEALKKEHDLLFKMIIYLIFTIILQLYGSHNTFIASSLTAGVPSVYTNWFSTLISFKPTQASPGM